VEQSGNFSNPYRYAGYIYDEEITLYNLKARYYDAGIARFLQEDTYLGDKNDPLSLNLYTYCKNEPLKYYDPTGHAPLSDAQYLAYAAQWGISTASNSPYKDIIDTINGTGGFSSFKNVPIYDGAAKLDYNKNTGDYSITYTSSGGVSSSSGGGGSSVISGNSRSTSNILQQPPVLSNMVAFLPIGASALSIYTHSALKTLDTRYFYKTDYLKH